jgi:hypothetical protein
MQRSSASRSSILGSVIAAAVALLLTASPASAGPVVVELYTSQGCNTCPPADALLGELRERDDILPLSIHVNYWDYLGWTDAYATEAGTARQHAYARPLRERFVYTPQMIFQGSTHTAGHRRGEVEAEIASAKSRAKDDLALTFGTDAAGHPTVTIPASDFTGKADVWLMPYDDEHTTEIRAGENAGRTLSYYNVVRDVTSIGTYDGRAETLTLPMAEGEDAGDGCAVLVQVAGLGPIIGAGAMRLPK